MTAQIATAQDETNLYWRLPTFVALGQTAVVLFFLCFTILVIGGAGRQVADPVLLWIALVAAAGTAFYVFSSETTSRREQMLTPAQFRAASLMLRVSLGIVIIQGLHSGTSILVGKLPGADLTRALVLAVLGMYLMAECHGDHLRRAAAPDPDLAPEPEPPAMPATAIALAPAPAIPPPLPTMPPPLPKTQPVDV